MTLLLHERVTRAAGAWPDRSAVVMGAERMTYRQLDQRSNQLARLLIDHGVRRGDRVCLLAPKAPVAIVGILAALKAGAAYVPVDTGAPLTRVEKIVAAAAPRVLLVGAAAAPLAGRLRTEAGIIAVSVGVAGELDGYASDAPSPAMQPTDPAQILFTSGSTGTPKGVVVTHAMVSAFLDWALSYFGHRPGDRISGHPPLHFDLSTFDIFGSLSSGAELHLVGPEVLLPAQLAEFIRQAELTQWFSVPSTFAYMARGDAVRQADFPSLERILWCGEVLQPAVLAYWMKRVPQCKYTNLYGPTETTIASSYYTVSGPPGEGSAAIPIGVPCAGESIDVVDDALEPVPAGEVGELVIAGAGLSPGYWRDERKTREAFVTDPRTGRRLYRTGDLGRCDEHGLLHFVGRADSQIKSRGYRIELGEIETALAALAGVDECAVVGVPSNDFTGTAICCAWASRPGSELDPRRLRAALSDVLPAYMIPTRWRQLEELPKNANGKIDRGALKLTFARAAAHG